MATQLTLPSGEPESRQIQIFEGFKIFWNPFRQSQNLTPSFLFWQIYLSAEGTKRVINGLRFSMKCWSCSTSVVSTQCILTCSRNFPTLSTFTIFPHQVHSQFSHIKYIHNFPTSSMYNHKFTLVSRKTMDVKMLSILMNKIQIDSFYFCWDFPLSGVILGMMRVSTIYILYQHYISSMTWSLFRHYSWKIEKWTDDSMRFLFTTTAFTETCTGWTFTFTFWCW